LQYSSGTTLRGNQGTEVTVQNTLSSGGFGVVYKGKTSRGKKCVIKQSLPGDTREEKLKVERKVLDRLGDYSKIPSLIDYDENTSPPYIVTDYIEGETLRERLKKGSGKFKTLSENEAREYGIKILEVLEYLQDGHGHNPVTHRDIKPENVMVNSRDEVHLIDFGTAVVEWVNATGKTMVFTPGFGAPEQGNPTGCAEIQADIYGVGTTLFFLLTGKDLKQDTTRKTCTTDSSGHERLKRPSEFISVSDAMDEIIKKATEIDYEDRYNTAEEMKKALEKNDPDPDKSKKTVLQFGGKEFELDLRPGESKDIGREVGVNNASVSNDIQIDNVHVSDKHAEIRRDSSGDYLIEDLGSSNGTAVNTGSGWNKLSKNQTWRLYSSDRIALAYHKNKGPCITLIFRDS